MTEAARAPQLTAALAFSLGVGAAVQATDGWAGPVDGAGSHENMLRLAGA